MGLAARSGVLKEYRLIYLTEKDEIWKRVEFSALNIDEAVARALHDAQGKTVHIWENGKFVQTLKLTNTRASALSTSAGMKAGSHRCCDQARQD